MSLISCRKLSRDFTVYKKKEGFKATLKAFVKRESYINQAVKDFDLEIKEPGLIGLLGPNGSGKTTLMKLLTGIISSSRGEVQVLGQNPFKRDNYFKKSISLVMGQKSQLWWDIPVMDSLLLFQRYYEIEEQAFRKRVEDLGGRLDVLNLLHVPVRKLSLGERMKMELMACLLHEPRLIFLDEPTIGLDIQAQRQARKFLKDYYEEKKPLIILTSHYMADVEALCEKLILILKGEKKFEGSIESFKGKFKSEKTIVFNFEKKVGDFPRNLSEKFFCEWNEEKTRLRLRAPEKDLNRVAAGVLTQFPVSDFHTEKVGVEEVMHEILSNS